MKKPKSFKLGIVADQSCACIHLDPAAAKACGFKPGDHIQISHEGRCTQVVRMLAHCGCKGMKANYVYLDTESMRYLEGNLHEIVYLSPAEYSLDTP